MSATAQQQHHLSTEVGIAFAALCAQRDEAADGWERSQAMLAQALALVEEKQRKVDALVACCEATLRYLEGPACMEVCDELAAVEAVIAMLRNAIGEARA